MTPSKRWQQWDWSKVIPKISYQWTINSQWDANYWQMMPRYIRHGYIFNNMVKAMPDHDLPQSEVDKMKNEVKFLTAYGWWQLVKTMVVSPSSPIILHPPILIWQI